MSYLATIDARIKIKPLLNLMEKATFLNFEPL